MAMYVDYINDTTNDKYNEVNIVGLKDNRAIFSESEMVATVNLLTFSIAYY